MHVPPPPFNGVSLDDARDWVQDNRAAGVTCPCCDQFVKVYPRSLPSATALVMIQMYRTNKGIDYVYLPPILDTMKRTPQQGGYGTFGHHWGLMEQQPGVRGDGSNRVGWWRLTDLGREFVRGTVSVPRKAYILNNQCLDYDGPPWMIWDALGTKFNYSELMQGL